MSELLAWVENSGEADQSVGSANDQVESLTNAVEQTNLETTERNPYLEFEEMMESWTVKGAAGDTCPRTLMGTACSVTTYTPALDPPLYALSWNLKSRPVFSGSF